MTQWEYKIVESQYQPVTGNDYQLTFLTEPQLTELGLKEWELISVIRLTNVKNYAEGTYGIQYLFKRPKKTLPPPVQIRCPHCGKEQSNSRFCSFCGESVT